jgi:hypothetical protein
VKRRLCDLDRGTLFRTADGLLWRPGYPATGATRWAHAVGRPQDSRGLPADAEVEVVDPAAVLARAALLERENAELRAVLHDLWQDRDGAAAGAAAERGAVLALRDAVLAKLEVAPGVTIPEDNGIRAALNVMERLIKARGPWRPPVPPCALEGAVREAVETLTGILPLMVHPDLRSGYDAPFQSLLARLRAALGEG